MRVLPVLSRFRWQLTELLAVQAREVAGIRESPAGGNLGDGMVSVGLRFDVMSRLVQPQFLDPAHRTHLKVLGEFRLQLPDTDADLIGEPRDTNFTLQVSLDEPN